MVCQKHDHDAAVLKYLLSRECGERPRCLDFHVAKFFRAETQLSDTVKGGEREKESGGGGGGRGTSLLLALVI